MAMPGGNPDILEVNKGTRWEKGKKTDKKTSSLGGKVTRVSAGLTPEIKRRMLDCALIPHYKTQERRTMTQHIVQGIIDVAMDTDHPKWIEAVRLILERCDGEAGLDQQIIIEAPKRMSYDDYKRAVEEGLADPGPIGEDDEG